MVENDHDTLCGCELCEPMYVDGYFCANCSKPLGKYEVIEQESSGGKGEYNREKLVDVCMDVEDELIELIDKSALLGDDELKNKAKEMQDLLGKKWRRYQEELEDNE